MGVVVAEHGEFVGGGGREGGRDGGEPAGHGSVVSVD